MALSLRDAADIIGRSYQNRSTVPYVLEDVPGGANFEFDYEWEVESAEDAPKVIVDAIRLVTHDGSEYPIRLNSVCPRWLAEIESLISEQVAADNEAAAEALR